MNRLLIGLLLVMGTSVANAAYYTETYSKDPGDAYGQFVKENKAYNFGFDMWFNNNSGGVGTNSNLTLTQDAVGAQNGSWKKASIWIDLFSTDRVFEKTKIKVVAWNEFGNKNGLIELDKFFWNKKGADNLYEWGYEFNMTELALFEEWGWGNVRIKALNTNKQGHDNDFAINKVSMTVKTVPEPYTLLLLGVGLFVFSLVNRKRL